MGLFFDVLSAINNPNQAASVDQLSQITGTVQQLATSQGIDPSTMQNVLSHLGGALRPVLEQQSGGLGGLVGQLAGSGAAAGALSSLLTPQLQQQIVSAVSSRTGIDADTLQGMLPTLIPVVLNLLNMGSTSSGSNPLLTAFLNNSNGQNADLGDVFKFAGRFLNPAIK